MKYNHPWTPSGIPPKRQPTTLITVLAFLAGSAIAVGAALLISWLFGWT